MRRELVLFAALVAGSIGCGDSAGEGGDEAGVASGLLGCSEDGAECTVVVVSQILDDRVEFYGARGPGSGYRGALDVDLKPNPGGDIVGDRLDEPYGLAWDGQRLHVLLSHYPEVEAGSLLSVHAEALAEVGPGEPFDVGAALGLTSPDADPERVRLTELDRVEPLSLATHPSDDALGEVLLVGVFANSLFVPESVWVNPSALLTVSTLDFGDPAEPVQIESTPVGCAGAWTMAALSEERVALACDGDEALAILDVTEARTGAAAAPHCSTALGFSGKRVRYLAPDGLGGVLVAESPIVASDVEQSRLWWYDGDCQLRGFTTFDDGERWPLGELRALPSELAAGPRWLMIRRDHEQRGVYALRGDPGAGSVEVCGQVSALDAASAWAPAAADPEAQTLEPRALALRTDGSAFALSTAPRDTLSDAAGFGGLWWVELDPSTGAPADPCSLDLGAAAVTDLGASAPSTDPELPQTWRRAPDVLTIVEL